ncbi:hypothetical protein P171DRAFT_363654 [Karstenula rhodostoma CBS 690.94]|uniref:Uncharacterized protein n=1 Tax=Karstenula rhodostoma CBS 690.94 TaxID=1392251 RepID=A0A9P4PFJ5_9PLEO|nr:hypothetical protein P171DRAFT_363654 [Karstenula rhodostoma CBS 690.94]
MSSPADPTAPSPLLDIPLEIRHAIFSQVAAARNIKPRYTLRYWFEKTDIQEQIAENLKNDPDANVTYVAGYNHQYNDEYEPLMQDDEVEDDDGENDEAEDQDEDAESEEEDENEHDEEDNGDAVEDEDEDENIDELMSDDVTDGAVAVPNIAQDVDTATTSTDLDQPATQNNQTLEDIYAPIAAPTVSMPDAQDESEVAVAAPETEGTHDAETADVGGDDSTAGDDVAAETASSDPPAPKVIIVKPNHMWRHVSKFMRLTQCPPQANLFVISKQLNIEAKKWFYDVATLNIDATVSFSHFSFFELALNKLAEAPFSPMENIKSAEITFVWDTTWIRAESTGFAGAVFPVLLKSRVDFILEILLRAPELEKLKITWHDSAQDDGAMQLRADTLEPFIMNLHATVETEDHYIAPDAKPRASSRAGKQRLEFKALFDNGCETF